MQLHNEIAAHFGWMLSASAASGDSTRALTQQKTRRIRGDGEERL